MESRALEVSGPHDAEFPKNNVPGDFLETVPPGGGRADDAVT